MEGWRRLLVGLTLIGLSAAWSWESQLLLFLSLGIAFVEIWEASFVISVAKRASDEAGSDELVARQQLAGTEASS